MQLQGREQTIDRAEAQRLVDQHPWWYHRFEIYPGIVTPGVYDASALFASLKLPDDLSGKTFLELGPADGYFTKQLDMRLNVGNVTDKDYYLAGYQSGRMLYMGDARNYRVTLNYEF